MDQTYQTSKYAADKIACLALLVVAVAIAYGISYIRRTKPLKAGAELVNQIQQKGVCTFLDNQGRHSFLLIKDIADRPVGFSIDVLTCNSSDVPEAVKAGSHFYIRGRQSRQQRTFFQSNNRLDRFSWITKTVSRAGTAGTEIVLADNSVTVTELGPQNDMRRFVPDPASMPNPLLDIVFLQMIENQTRRAILNVITPEGTVSPTLVSAKQVKGSARTDQRPGYKFTVKLLDGSGSSEVVSLNTQKEISRIVLKQDHMLTFEPTTPENIVRLFPEHADYILQAGEILEEKLQEQ